MMVIKFVNIEILSKAENSKNARKRPSRLKANVEMTKRRKAKIL